MKRKLKGQPALRSNISSRKVSDRRQDVQELGSWRKCLLGMKSGRERERGREGKKERWGVERAEEEASHFTFSADLSKSYF